MDNINLTVTSNQAGLNAKLADLKTKLADINTAIDDISNFELIYSVTPEAAGTTPVQEEASPDTEQ